MKTTWNRKKVAGRVLHGLVAGILIDDLHAAGAMQPLIDALNRDFGNLRAVLQAQDAALVEPVLARFGQTLSEVAAARAELERKCDDLQRRLERLLDPRPESSGAGKAWDEELPF